VLRAPIAGVIVERQVNPGMEARPDLANPLFTLSDIAHLWLLIDLPERYLSNVAVNQQVTFTVDAYPSQRFTAKVIRIAQTVDPVTRRVQVRCSVANDDGRLKPEMFASAVLTGAEQQRSLRIPSSAVINEGLYSYVFVQVGPGQFVKRRVSVLRQDASGVYLPAEGGTVSKTDQVVVKGALLLNSELSAGG
jgi:cobalt-zinc-cadmium efflux system membrane fusion protein